MGQFFGIAARTMRRVLLDYARQRQAGKRGGYGARKVDVDAELLVSDDRLEEVVAIDEVLTRLSAPEWLRKSWESSMQAGLNRLSSEEIQAEIAAARKARREILSARRMIRVVLDTNIIVSASLQPTRAACPGLHVGNRRFAPTVR